GVDAQLHGRGAYVVVDAAAQHAALDLQTEGVGRGPDVAEGDVAVLGPDHQRRRRGERADQAAQAGDVAAGVGDGGVDQDPAGDAAADGDGRAALQQVVLLQVLEEIRIGAARREAVAGAVDRPVDDQRAADVAAEVGGLHVLADRVDRATQGHGAADPAQGAHPDAVVAGDAEGASGVELPREVGLDGDAERVVALDRDRAGALVQQIAREVARADDPDPDPVGPIGEGPMRDAVLVGGRGGGVVHLDRPVVGDGPGVAAERQDAGDVVHVLESDDPDVVDGI